MSEKEYVSLKSGARAILGSSRLFRGLDNRIIDGLGNVAIHRTYRGQQCVFSQGDPGDALYCVASGRVRIEAVGEGGQEVFLNIMEPGDSFGEIAVIDGLPRTARAVAMERTTLIVVKRADLLSELAREPELALHLLGLFCQRIRWTSDLVEESAFLAAPARLAKRLLSLATLHGRRTSSGIEFKISQAELGKFLGMSRQIVNENLQVWKAMGWLSISRGLLLIQNVDSLRAIASGPTRPDSSFDSAAAND